jgi:hypothetical protein
MLTRWILCACLAPLAHAAVLTANLEAKVGPNYQPESSDERLIWQRLDRIEEGIRTSPQRLIAPELDAYTRGVVERLIGRAAPDLRIYVVQDASLNAAMLPSGFMIVNTGLLARVRNEAQLAAVLGHEAGHYFRKHSLDMHRDNRRKSAVAAASAHYSSYDDAGNSAWSMINQAILMSGSRFSRDLESEADAYGLMLMERAGYPPRAAFAMWEQVVDERRASAAERHKRYRDETRAELSTHPPTEERMNNLADTAASLARAGELAGGERHEEWAAVIRPYQAMLLQEQICLNDPGASLYLLDSLANDGWTGLLRFNEGEVYRLRNANGDDLKAAAAYAAAIEFPDAPPEAWRAHGYALLKAGNKSEAGEALRRYLAMEPDAPDAAVIRFTLTRAVSAEEAQVAGSDMAVKAGPDWKKVPASMSQTQWKEMWTWNGPQLDRIAVLGGLPDGKALNRNANSDQQVPAFHADMTPLDLMSMVEVAYRVNGVTVFHFESVEPEDFLGGSGVRLRYNYTSGIGIAKRGSCVMRVVDGKLYAMKLESVAGHYFEIVGPEFDRLVAGAELLK